MENKYITMYNKLESLRDTLIQAIQSSINSDELTQKLISLSAKDPSNSDVYQLILLVSSNTETTHNSFKQTSIRTITEMISQKIKLIEILERHEEKITELENKIIVVPRTIKFPIIGDVEVGVIKLKDIILLSTLLFMAIFIMNIANEQSTSKTIESFKSSNLMGKLK